MKRFEGTAATGGVSDRHQAWNHLALEHQAPDPARKNLQSRFAPRFSASARDERRRFSSALVIRLRGSIPPKGPRAPLRVGKLQLWPVGSPPKNRSRPKPGRAAMDESVGRRGFRS